MSCVQQGICFIGQVCHTRVGTEDVTLHCLSSEENK